MYELVAAMHLKFAIPEDESVKNMLFRVIAMQEELVEFGGAVLGNDRHAQLDALVDLTVFAFGTAVQLGFSADQFEGAFEEVMRANMAKKLGPNNKRGNHSLDLIKPDGWQAPNLEPFL